MIRGRDAGPGRGRRGPALRRRHEPPVKRDGPRRPGPGPRGRPAEAAHRGRLAAGLAVLALTTFAAGAGRPAAQPRLPVLDVDAPAALQAVAERIGRFPLTGLADAMTLAGLTDPGPPINVLLIAEGSELARNSPSWISGFADAGRNLVVLFPERTRRYPTDSLEALLQHEVAHVLFSRAARGRPVPRWFNEGLALAAERPVGFEDRSRLAWTRIRHGEITLSELERLFTGGPAATRRAYAVAGALVRDLLERHGEASAGRILAGLGRDQSFPRAFAEATGEPLAAAVDRFWRRRPVWVRWVAFAGRPAFQWMFITFLALCAIHAHRRRRAEQRRRWAEEEEAAFAADPRERLRAADPRAPGSAYDEH